MVSIFVGLESFGLYDTRVLNLCTGDVDLLKSLQNGMIWVRSIVMSTLRCNGSLAKYLRTTQMKSIDIEAVLHNAIDSFCGNIIPGRHWSQFRF